MGPGSRSACPGRHRWIRISNSALSSFRGAPLWREPGIHTHDGGYGFRVRRCAAPRNDDRVWTHLRIPAARFRPGHVETCVPQKQEGTGNAGCSAAPMARLQTKKQAAVTTGVPKRPAFPARWCYGLYVISPEYRAC